MIQLLFFVLKNVLISASESDVVLVDYSDFTYTYEYTKPTDDDLDDLIDELLEYYEIDEFTDE